MNGVWEGWHLIGSYPKGDPDGVGSWLLHHGGEAMLFEVPPCIKSGDVSVALAAVGARLTYVTASHDHEDHWDKGAWRALRGFFPAAAFIRPETGVGDALLDIGGEPLWLLRTPKHSLTDTVVIFRGVAMTGDIELGMLGSVNDEVSVTVKRRSMKALRSFCRRSGYHIHSVVSAHLNDVRRNVDWEALMVT